MSDRGFDLDSTSGGFENDYRRTLRPANRIAERVRLSHPPSGGLPVLDTEDVLVFASDNYLGLTTSDAVTNASTQGARVVGTGTGSSRITAGDTVIHHDLERLLADTCGTERALTFSSADTALTDTIRCLEPDVVFVDIESVDRVSDGCKLTDAVLIAYDHCDPESLRQSMRERIDNGHSTRLTGRSRETKTAQNTTGVFHPSTSEQTEQSREPSDSTTVIRSATAEDTSRLNRATASSTENRSVVGDSERGPNESVTEKTRMNSASTAESWLVVTDSVFACSGSVAPLEALCDVTETFGAWIAVEESHAIGLYANGGGLTRGMGLENRVPIQVGSLGTTLASQGGFIAGSDALVEYLVRTAPSIEHTIGIAPPAATAASEALSESRDSTRRETFWDNVSHLRTGLDSIGY